MQRLVFLLSLCTVLRAGETIPYTMGGCENPHVPEKMNFYQMVLEALNAKEYERALVYQHFPVMKDCKSPHRWMELIPVLWKNINVDENTRVRRAQGILAKASQYVENIEDLCEPFLSSPDKELHATLKTLLTFPQFVKSAEYQKICAQRIQWQERKKTFDEMLKKIEEKNKAPSQYVAEGACPGECCTFKEWTAIKDAILLDHPLAGKTVGKVSAGEKVVGLTGNYYVAPVPFLVRANYSPEEIDQNDKPPVVFKAQSVAYLLNPRSEGFYNVWYQGKTHSIDATNIVAYCPHPPAECWAEMFEPIDASHGEWWIKIRLPKGRGEGWVKDESQFTGMDSCS